MSLALPAVRAAVLTPRNAVPCVEDIFTRADNSLLGSTTTGQAWTEDVGQYSIVSNQIRPVSLTGSLALATFDSGLAYGTFAAQVNLGTDTTAATTRSLGIAFGYVDTSNYVFLDVVRTTSGTGALSLRLFKVVAGSATLVGSATVPVPANTWIGLQAVRVGNTVHCYYDGVYKFSATDAAFPVGTKVGLRYGSGSVATTNARADSIAAYAASAAAAAQQRYRKPPVWTRRGVVIAPAVAWEGANTDEPTLMYEGGVFKCWYRAGHPTQAPFAAIGYATSPDGITWTKDAGNPVLSEASIGFWCPHVLKEGGTYYCYYTRQASAGVSTLDWATSADGITWAVQGTALSLVVPELNFGNKFVFVEAGTWYMIYEYQVASSPTRWALALATSADGVAWTRYGSNPVLASSGTYGGPEVHKVGATYFMWVQQVVASNTPTDIHLHSSLDLITWTSHGTQPVFPRTETWEKNQTADVSMVEVNGTTYMLYCGVQTPTEQLGLATTSYTIAQLVGSDLLL